MQQGSDYTAPRHPAVDIATSFIFAASVILLLLLFYPAVLVDTIEGCVKWAEWNPNEGVTQYKRMYFNYTHQPCY